MKLRKFRHAFGEKNHKMRVETSIDGNFSFCFHSSMVVFNKIHSLRRFLPNRIHFLSVLFLSSVARVLFCLLFHCWATNFHSGEVGKKFHYTDFLRWLILPASCECEAICRKAWERLNGLTFSMHNWNIAFAQRARIWSERKRELGKRREK
jgi:hypothetical protein